MSQKNTSYDRIIVGATCPGVGCALGRPEGTLLVEPSGTIAGEWTETMHPGSGWEQCGDLTADAVGLWDELERRRILVEGRFHLPALSPVLFQRLYESPVRYAFLTRITECRYENGRFVLDLLDAGGHHTVEAGRVIDTTVPFLSGTAQKPRVIASSVGVNCNYTQENVPAKHGMSGEGWVLYAGRYLREAFLSLDLPAGTDWPRARAAVTAFFRELPAEMKGWEAASTATRLFETVEPVDTGRPEWRHEPATAFSNAVRGFDRGCRMAAEPVCA